MNNMAGESCENGDFNITNHSVPVILDTYKALAGGISFLFTLPFVLFHFGFFPIGSTSAVLVGAFLMVVTLVVSQHQVYEVVGSAENMRTIFLLLGMMLLAQYFEREHMIQKLMSKFLKPDSNFPKYLFVVTAADFIVAAIFTNDVACVVLTPLILRHWKSSDRPVVELGTLLLGIATMANIGSVTTIFGNPQMALIASKTSEIEYKLSQLDMRRCIFYLWLPAAFCYGINFGFLMIHYLIRKRYTPARVKALEAKFKHEKVNEPVGDNFKLEITVNSSDLSTHNQDYHSHSNVAHPAVNMLSDELLQYRKESVISTTSTFQEVEKPEPDALSANAVQLSNKPHIYRSLSIGSVAKVGKEVEEELIADRDFISTNSIPFRIILCLSVILIVALFLASSDTVQFDTGLVPVGAAIIVICADAAINKRASLAVMKRVDWSVLMMFFGIFVWLFGLNSTKIPRLVWQKLGLAESGLNTLLNYVIFYVFIVVGSNVFSNVPLTIIVLELLSPCVDQLDLVLYLGWLATIAGNLTLFGSVANLIVAQKSLTTLDYHFGFFEYLEFGLLTTIILSIFGMVIIFGLLIIV